MTPSRIHYERCLAILGDVEDAGRGVGGAVAGRLRVDVAGKLACTVLLPAFLAKHPRFTAHLSEGERFIDVVREGFNCDVVVRRLGVMDEGACASRENLAAHGVPPTPDDPGHGMIAFVTSRVDRTC